MEKNLSAQLLEEKKFHSYNYESGNPARSEERRVGKEC